MRPCGRLEALLILLAVTVGLRAQSGFVRAGNQPLPGATVTATQGSQQVATTTDENGHYVFPALGAGTWTVEARMFGFDPAKKEIDFAQTKTADFKLQLSESPMAGRMARLAGARASGQSANQLETQLQTELNASQMPAPAPAPATSQDGNEAFLVSGSLSDGLNSNAPPDFLGMPMPGGAGFPGGRDQLSAQAPNSPGFGGGAPGGPGGPGGGGPAAALAADLEASAAAEAEAVDLAAAAVVREDFAGRVKAHSLGTAEPRARFTAWRTLP